MNRLIAKKSKWIVFQNRHKIFLFWTHNETFPISLSLICFRKLSTIFDNIHWQKILKWVYLLFAVNKLLVFWKCCYYEKMALIWAVRGFKLCERTVTTFGDLSLIVDFTYVVLNLKITYQFKETNELRILTFLYSLFL